MARILLADDDAATCRMIERALTGEGHDVVVCSDGAEALDQIGAGVAFDLLVTDINMPEVDGSALAREAVARLPSVKVLMISGLAEQLEKIEDVKAAKSDVLAKPFSLEALRAKVGDVLR